MKLLSKLAVVIVALGSVSVANASIITIQFQGEIDFFRVINLDPFDGAISVGTQFSGFYRFDTNIDPVGTENDATYRDYNPSVGFHINIAGLSGDSSTAEVPLNYRIINDLAGGDVQDIQTQGMSFGGVNAYLTQIFLQDTTGTAFDNTSLPSAPPSLDKYDVATFALGLGFTNEVDVIMIGRFTSFSAVPEPGTLALLGIGLFGMGFARCFKKA